MVVSPSPLARSFSTRHQDSLVELAQKKFNETKQELNDKKHAYMYTSRSLAIDDDKKEASQLLSTLLYLCVMMEKVDGIKQMLLHQNPKLYEEWRSLFDSLHSPSSKLQERLVHNDRVKQTYRRKQYYKGELEKTQNDHEKFMVEAERIQQESKLSDEQLNSTISTLTDTLSKLDQRLVEKETECKDIAVDKQAQREEHNKEMADAKQESTELQLKLESKENELQRVREELKVATEKHRQESLIASQSLDRAIKEGEEAKAMLEETRGKLREKDENFISAISELRESIASMEQKQIQPIPLASIVSLLEEQATCPCKAREAQENIAVIIVDTAVSEAIDAAVKSQESEGQVEKI